MKFYEVITKRRFNSSQSVLTYSSSESVAIGAIVKVPFGNSTTLGVVSGKAAKPSFATKPISKVLVAEALSSQQVQLITWISEYYASPPSETLQLFIPPSLDAKPRKTSEDKPSEQSAPEEHPLNSHQKKAIQTIADRSDKTTLLHGVTGSGKTRIYIERARQLLDEGRSVIVLVPEINLTPQLVREFELRLGNVYSTHSRLTAAQRRNVWLDIAADEKPKIIIGPRSALFLPVENLGGVFIDEFHEQSYKQDKTPKYDTTRVAAYYSKLCKAQLVLGSATPPVNDYYIASTTDPEAVITLSHKARENTVKPEVSTIDLKDKNERSSYGLWLSKTLHTKIKETLERGEQSLLFLNRRGSARLSLCDNCGWVAECPRCSVPFTLHADKKYLKCHVCDTTKPVHPSCPDCDNVDIQYRGVGTKQIETDVRKLFPSACIARFDGDNNKDETLNALYEQVREGEIDILIGTQTLVKGLDLPKLGLVAAVSAEASLLMPDFSSRERTFQLINQLVGRVGRDHRKTEVVIQTYDTDSDVISWALAGDYEQFYQDEIKTRTQYLYPPFVFMLKLNVMYASSSRTHEAAREFKQQLSNIPGITVLGPAPAFYERINKKYNWQLVVKSKSRSKLTEIVKTLPQNGKWRFELDPSDLL